MMTDRFASAWAPDLRAFLAFKRALGYRYHRAEVTLLAFDRFLLSQGRNRGRRRLDETFLAWLERQKGRKPVTVATEVVVFRQFYAFLKRGRHPGLREPAWPQLPTTSNFVPYIFSKQEVRQLLRLTSTLRHPPFRRITYKTLLLVLYCTGLRFSEALRLRMRDVDVVNGTFFVVESKGRSRWVPCHHSLCQELKRYLEARRLFAPAGPDDYLFVNANKTKLGRHWTSATVRHLLRMAGLKPASGRVGPRPYDMRHAFAIHRLTRWCRAGVDLHARLPWLSAYMGHDDLLGTETYLTATPELLSLAAARFHRHYETAGRER